MSESLQREIQHDNDSRVQIGVSNTIYSCSTLLLYNFPKRYGSFKSSEYSIDPLVGKPGGTIFSTEENSTFEKFVEELHQTIGMYDTQVRSAYSDYTVNSFSFVTASVRKEQGLISQYLEKMGFYGTPWVANTKNKSVVRFFIMPIPEFIKALEEACGKPFPKGVKPDSTYDENLNDFEN